MKKFVVFFLMMMLLGVTTSFASTRGKKEKTPESVNLIFAIIDSVSISDKVVYLCTETEGKLFTTNQAQEFVFSHSAPLPNEKDLIMIPEKWEDFNVIALNDALLKIHQKRNYIMMPYVYRGRVDYFDPRSPSYGFNTRFPPNEESSCFFFIREKEKIPQK